MVFAATKMKLVATAVFCFMAQAKDVYGGDEQLATALDRLKNSYGIPETDVNFQQLTSGLKSGYSSGLGNIITPVPPIAPTTAGTGESWWTSIFGSGGSSNDPSYDTARRYDWGGDTGYNGPDDPESYRIWSMFKSVIMVFCLYLILGSAIRYKYYGNRGVEVIPHLEFWQNSFNSLQDNFVLVAEKVGVSKLALSHVSQKSEYEDFGL